MVQAVVQAMQMMGGAGGAGGTGGMPGMGKPATKKVDPAILDTKLWQIMRMVAEIMNHMQIPIPADVALGPPPDPMQMQMANQDQAGALPAGDPAAAGMDPAAAAGGQPSAIPPIDPIQGAAPGMAAGKTASDYQGIGSSVSKSASSLTPAQSMANLAALARSLGNADRVFPKAG
jgi:hypothetical protein